MIVGMDFGTTNSGMSVYDGHDLRLIPLDEANRNPYVARTALYITNDRRVFIGREAIETYYEENLNRPSRYERVHIGEIELTFAELPTFIRDVHIEKDVYSPGRLFVSFKMGLSSPNYLGTIVGSQYFFLEDIIATYLFITKQRAEQELKTELDSIVLGRPVRFSEDSEHNQYARERLIMAAFRAGYKTVYLQYEPIAAAYYYETTIDDEQKVLIFDFGGGTLDMSIVQLGNPKTRRVIANGGIPIAGDVFDQRIVRAKLPPHFGEGSTYRSGHSELPLPNSYYDAFMDWQTLLNLQMPRTMEDLKRLELNAKYPRKIRALINLIQGQYGLRMYDVAEKAKRQLSNYAGARLDMHGEGFKVFESITRSEFERIIRSDANTIAERLDSVLADAGLEHDDIDAVIRTGGSSQIPLFVELLTERFGAEKVRHIDAFSSVTSGLGVIAHRIEQGELDLPAYHVENFMGSEQLHADQQNRVPVVDLDVLKKLIQAQEKRQQVAPDYHTLVTQNADGHIQAVQSPALEDAIELAALGLEGVAAGSYATYNMADDRIALLTSDFTCLVKTPAELVDLNNIGLTLAQLEGFRVDEFSREAVYSVARLEQLRDKNYIVIISSLGYGQKFIGERLLERIDRPVSYQFVKSRGYPAALVGVPEGAEFVAISSSGRGVRIPIQRVTLKESRLLSVPLKGRIIGAFASNDAEEVIIATQHGYIKRMDINAISRSEKLNTTGGKLSVRSSVVAALPYQADSNLWALTNHRLLSIDAAAIPHDNGDQNTYKLPNLRKGEKLATLLFVT